jgi:hypothetical protein
MKTKIEPVKVETDIDDEETYAVGSAKIHIRQDDNTESPREWCNSWTWYSNHRRYSFDRDYKTRHWYKIDDIFDGETEEGETVRDAILRQNPDLLDVRPIYMLDHSGVSVSLGSFNDPWDSGVGAFAVITREQAEKDCPDLKGNDEKLKERAYGWLKDEVETYQQFLSGEVYGYVVEDGSGEELDSCWGYYSIKDALDDALSQVSVKDRTIRKLGGLDIINMVNEKQGMHFCKISWTDEVKDGEKLYTTAVSLEAEYTETYGNPDALALQLGYMRGEFDGHSLKVWNDTEEGEKQ